MIAVVSIGPLPASPPEGFDYENTFCVLQRNRLPGKRSTVATAPNMTPRSATDEAWCALVKAGSMKGKCPSRKCIEVGVREKLDFHLAEVDYFG